MTIEATLVTAIGAICPIYPDEVPAGTLPPFATYQQVGGQVINPIDGSVPNLRNARVQINVWSTTRAQANALMRSIEDALRPDPIGGRPIGALIARKEPSDPLRGAQQDFTIWHE